MNPIYKRLKVVLPAIFLVAAGAAVATPSYILSKEIGLGDSSEVISLSLDSKSHRLYAVDSNSIACLDMESEKITGRITTGGGARNIAIVPLHQLGFYGSGADSKLYMVNLPSLKRAKRLGGGKDPAAIIYQAGQDQIFAFDGIGQSVKVYEADDGDFLTTIHLSGTPVAATCDSSRGIVFCSIAETDEILSIDARKLKVLNHWPSAPGKRPAALAIDVKNHRLFVGCANNQLLILNADSGKIISSVPLDASAGVVEFDPGTDSIVCVSAHGTVSVVQESSPEKFDTAQSFSTPAGTKAMALDPASHTLYLTKPISGLETEKDIPKRGSVIQVYKISGFGNSSK